jgi:tripartite-type tricarboxylate transporter receptor subunit TctC
MKALLERSLAWLLPALLIAAPVGQALADFPDKPVTLIVGYPPGGPSDVMARILTPELSKRLGQPVVVENKPGANGMLAAKIVAQSAPEGYVLNVSGLANITNALLNPGTGVELSDVTWVALIGRNSSVMLVPAQSELKTVQDVITYAKANPGKLNCGSGGVGSSPHFTCELFKSVTGTEIRHVSYKGMAPALTDLIGGRIELLFNTALQSKPFVEEGKLRALAVSSPQRSSALPDVPTLREQNVDVGVTTWTGVTAAPGTPPAVVEKLNEAFRAALEMPDIAEKLGAIGVEIDNLTVKALQDYAKSEEVFWAALIKKADIAAK